MADLRVYSSPTLSSATHATDGARVPQELVDYTIDFLHDDISTLRTSSLVSRWWLPASSFHLFACVRWPPCKHQWDALAESIDDACRCHLVGDTDTLEELLLLLSSAPRICNNVRDLRIAMSWHKQGSFWTNERFISTSPHQLVTILDLVPSVSRLEILNLSFGPQASSISSHTALRRLEELALVLPLHRRDIDYPCIKSFLSYFQAISTLVFGFQFRAGQAAEISLNLLLPPAPPIQVNKLELQHISYHDGSVWLSLLLECIDMATLTSFSLEDNHSLGGGFLTPTMHNFLRCCTNLRSLTCYRGAFRTLVSYPTPCLTLHQLHFLGNCIFDAYVGVHRSDWDAISEIMTCPLASAVQDATLDFMFIKRITGLPNDSIDLFEQQLRAILESLDWTALSDSCRRLQSFTMELRLYVEKPRDSQIWEGDREMCRAMAENVVQDRLSVPAQLNFKLRISYSF